MSIHVQIKHGFTLIELMVSISIIALVVGGAVAGYGSFSNRNLLKQTALTLKNDLRLAQTKASTGNKPEGCYKLFSYQILFNTDRYSISPYCFDALGVGVTGSSVKNVLLPEGIEMVLPSTNPIDFLILSKGTNIPVSTSLLLTGVAGSYQLDVSANGDIVDINAL